jgi:glycosyltransferase involved in cell wall biosynthesis
LTDFVFLFSHIPDPRINKRISVAKARGSVALVAWDKQVTSAWTLQHDDIENNVIQVRNTSDNLIQRTAHTLSFAVKALRLLRQLQPQCIYVGNIDMLLIASIYKKSHPTQIIYEVADLNRLIADPQRSPAKKIVRFGLIRLEKNLCRKIHSLVLTSNKFYDHYYSQFVPQNKVLEMPNIPNLEAFKAYRKITHDFFTIGFIGGIRYLNQLKMLVNATEKTGTKVFVAGTGFRPGDEEALLQYCEGKEHVEFYGRYDYHREVASLYERCDCIYAVYDTSLNNVKIALPNKLYESIYCELPIIVAKGTYLAELATKQNVGVAVSDQNEDELVQVIQRLSTDATFYNTIVRSCQAHREEINPERYNLALAKQFDIVLENRP